MRAAIALLVFIFSTQPLLACENLLLTKAEARQAFSREFKLAASESRAMRRLVLGLKKTFIRRRVLKECAAAPGGCRAAAIAREVRRAVADARIPNALGYGFLVGGMLANSAVSSTLLTMVSPKLEFMPLFASSFLGQLSFVSVSLLAPFLEPLSNRIRRSTFALAKGGLERRQPTATLDAQADLINSTYTLREQHATDRILTLRNALRLNLETAARAIATGDRESVVAELADAAMMGYRHFRDLSPAEAMFPA